MWHELTVAALILAVGLVLGKAATTEAADRLEKATFAGGCFWCMVYPFEQIQGVTSVISGYTGGNTKNPTYDEVSGGTTGHVEAVQITYDPAQVKYARLLDLFWRQIDPTDAGGQFADRGPQYQPVIFYHSEEQRLEAERSKQALEASGRFDRPVATAILPAKPFYPAEDYHQGYYGKKPLQYKLYRAGSGREAFLDRAWKRNGDPMATGTKTFVKPSRAELKNQLTPLQFNVTQQNGTEQAFHNEYWNNHREGIYVDLVSGEPLFSSKDTFESGTGWPSFTRPLEPGNLVEKEDRSLFTTRTEVRSRLGDSHLGHVFNDGPQPTGLRYCINSAALRFVPADELEAQGYADYRTRFEQKDHVK